MSDGTVDFPNARESLTCPVCGLRKTLGLIVCWPCWNAYDGRGGFSAVALAAIEKYERDATWAE